MSSELVVNALDKIDSAFSQVHFPGEKSIVIGNLKDDEVINTRIVFEQEKDWRLINSTILDTAPNGLASALSFFSPKGFCFFIPAFMTADLHGKLLRVDPTFFLCLHIGALTTPDGVVLKTNINRDFPNETAARLGVFNRQQCEAIACYLTVVALRSDDDCAMECASGWKKLGASR